MSERLQAQRCNNLTTCSLKSNNSKFLSKNRKTLMLQPPLVQTKLSISQPGDKYEQEADRAANQFINSGESLSRVFIVSSRHSAQRVQCNGRDTESIRRQTEAKQRYLNFIIDAEKYGLPVSFMKRVGREYRISYGSDAVFYYLNSMFLEEETLNRVRKMSPDKPYGEGTGIYLIYEESTHAYLDLVSDEPKYKQFIARGKTYYQGAPIKGGRKTTDPDRVFNEAAASYVGSRVATWWSAFEMLSLYISKASSNPTKAESIKKKLPEVRDDYNRRMADVVFGYSEEGGFLGIGSKQMETTRPMNTDMKAFLDHEILEDKIPDRFEQVNGFQQMLSKARMQLNPSIPANSAPRRIAPKSNQDEPEISLQNLEDFLSSISGRGYPLDHETREIMEHYFGYDFKGIRIHTDDRAAESAHLIGALAYTSGNNIVFSNGQFSPHTDKGRHLIAHELTHVIQQEGVNHLPAITSGNYGYVRPEAVQLPLQQTPIVQMQRNSLHVISKTVVEIEFENFLIREWNAQSGKKDVFRITPAVIQGLRTVFKRDLPAMLLLGSLAQEETKTYENPEKYMELIRNKLPKTVSSDILRSLSKLPARKREPTLFEAAKDYLTKKPEVPWRTVLPNDREKRENDIWEQTKHLRGQEEKKIGPVDFDLKKGYEYLVDKQRKRKSDIKSEAVGLTDAEFSAILGNKISEEALVPPEVLARKKHLEELCEVAGPDEEKKIKQQLQNVYDEIESYGSAKLAAYKMAYRLDRAFKNRQFSIDMDLGGVYTNTKETQAVLDRLKKIAIIVKNSLKHHAAGVNHINVFFGNRKVGEIHLR